MSDSSNSIDIVVQNSVDPQIAPRLITIADGADKASKSLGTLKDQLKGVNGSGLSSLLSQLNGAGSVTGALAQQTDSLRSKTDSLSSSQRSLSATCNAARASLTAQAQAATALSEALAEEERIQDAVNAGVAYFEEALASAQSEANAYTASLAGIAAAHELAAAASSATTQQESIFGSTLAETSAMLEGQGVLWAETFDQRRQLTVEEVIAQDQLRLSTESLVSADERFLEMQQLVADVMGETAAATVRASEATAAKTVTDSESVVASGAVVSANVSAAAALGLVEGRTLSITRAAANFITKTLGFGAIFETLFPIIGLVALVAVIYQGVEAFDKFYNKAKNAASAIASSFDGVINPLSKANDSLAVTNDKLDQTIAKLEHKPTSNGAQLALDQARQAADRLDDSLEKVNKDLDSILNKNRIGAIQGILTGQGGTSDVESLIRSSFGDIDKARSAATSALDTASANKDPKAAKAATVAAYATERAAIQSTIDTLNAKYNALKKVQDEQKNAGGPDVSTSGPGQLSITGLAVKDQTANLTLLGKSVQLAQQDLRGLDETYSNIGKNATVDKLRDSTSQLKNETKEAAAQWKQLEAEFVKYQASVIATTGRKATPQQDLSFLVGKEATNNPLNTNKLSAKELPYRNQIASQNFKDDETQKLTDQVSEIGLYSNALKEASEMNKILEEAKKKNITLTVDEIAGYQSLINQIVESKEYTQELASTYNELNAPLVKYQGSLAAIFTLQQRGQLTQAQVAQGIAETTKQYTEATSAVVRYQHELQDADRDSSSKLGTDKHIQLSTNISDFDKTLRQPNADAAHPFGYSEQEIQKVNAAITPLLKAQQDKNALDQASNALLNEQDNLLDRITLQQQALAVAVKAGAISQEAANSANVKGNAELNDTQLKNGTATSQKAPFLGALQDYVKDFTTVAASLKKTYADTFKTISDGIADSIGRAIAYSQNLGQAFKDVARSAIGEFISALIKLAIQWAITSELAKKLNIPQPGGDSKKTAAATATSTALSLGALAVTTAASYAAAKLLSPAWWDVAEAVSLATLGANAIGAVAGISTVIATGATAQAHKDGGLITGPGTGRSDSILSRLSNGEFVVNAQATANNLDLLHSINSGGTQQAQLPAPQTHTSNGAVKTQTKVEVHNYGSSRVQVQQMDENTVRLIVRDEAPALVAQHAPSVIANDIGNPNSRTSKAIKNNVVTTRIR